jgi:Calcineurin-like phosphoesterase
MVQRGRAAPEELQSAPVQLRNALFAALLLLAPAARAADPVVAAAGDIACDPAHANFNGGNGTATGCRQRATSDLLVGAGYDAVLLLGDNQYEDGALGKYQAVFAPTWGRLGSLLRPAPGNHEYLTPGATGYFDYFGPAAGERSRGYYSYDLGTWHIIALNSNCAEIGGCGPGSLQLQWLAQDLAAHPRACTLAYWHHPRFSSGQHNNDATYDAFWQALYQAGVDLVLAGHDHDYERFAPQDPSGKADPEHGIRELVVGTGGRETRPFATIRPNSEVRNAQDLGVLELRLRADGYDWRFLPAPGGTFTDAGSAGCHNAPNAASLSLHQGRFEAEATWRDFDGNSGSGRAGAPAADGSGLFWFFSPQNWELLVKVIDGCALNHRFWVFAAATTNVGYSLTVTDTRTGRTARYENPLGRRSPAVTDTSAFDTCP